MYRAKILFIWSRGHGFTSGFLVGLCCSYFFSFVCCPMLPVSLGSIDCPRLPVSLGSLDCPFNCFLTSIWTTIKSIFFIIVYKYISILYPTFHFAMFISTIKVDLDTYCTSLKEESKDLFSFNVFAFLFNLFSYFRSVNHRVSYTQTNILRIWIQIIFRSLWNSVLFHAHPCSYPFFTTLLKDMHKTNTHFSVYCIYIYTPYNNVNSINLQPCRYELYPCLQYILYVKTIYILFIFQQIMICSFLYI